MFFKEVNKNEKMLRILYAKENYKIKRYKYGIIY
jgi:hypothetical protein